jgi:hypothetical protein
LKTSIEGILKKDFLPLYVMCDGADAIRGSARDFFSHIFKQLMCYFHLKKNADAKISSKEYFDNEEDRKKNKKAS